MAFSLSRFIAGTAGGVADAADARAKKQDALDLIKVQTEITDAREASRRTWQTREDTIAHDRTVGREDTRAAEQTRQFNVTTAETKAEREADNRARDIQNAQGAAGRRLTDQKAEIELEAFQANERDKAIVETDVLNANREAAQKRIDQYNKTYADGKGIKYHEIKGGVDPVSGLANPDKLIRTDAEGNATVVDTSGAKGSGATNNDPLGFGNRDPKPGSQQQKAAPTGQTDIGRILQRPGGTLPADAPAPQIKPGIIEQQTDPKAKPETKAKGRDSGQYQRDQQETTRRNFNKDIGRLSPQELRDRYMPLDIFNRLTTQQQQQLLAKTTNR